MEKKLKDVIPDSIQRRRAIDLFLSGSMSLSSVENSSTQITVPSINTESSSQSRHTQVVPTPTSSRKANQRQPLKALPMNIKEQIQQQQHSLVSVQSTQGKMKATKWMKSSSDVYGENVKPDIRSVMEKQLGAMR